MWHDYSFLADELGSKDKPVVGISACLIGEKVRYDGNDKHQPTLLAAINATVQLLPLCPEVAIGLGVPRPPIQLVKESNTIRAVPVDENAVGDYTAALQDYAQQVMASREEPINRKLCGYIFKSRSPSCGLGSTPLFNEGNQIGFGSGIYAHTLVSNLPWIPVAEEEDFTSQITFDYFLFRVSLNHDFNLCLTQDDGLAAFTKHHARLIEIAPRHARARLLAEVERLTIGDTSQGINFLTLLGESLGELGPAGLKSELANR